MLIGQFCTKHGAKTPFVCRCAYCTLLVSIGTGDSGRAGDCTDITEEDEQVLSNQVT